MTTFPGLWGLSLSLTEKNFRGGMSSKVKQVLLEGTEEGEGEARI